MRGDLANDSAEWRRNMSIIEGAFTDAEFSDEDMPHVLALLSRK